MTPLLIFVMEDSLDSPGRDYFSFVKAPQEIIRVFDSIYFRVLDSLESSGMKDDKGKREVFIKRLNEELWRNEKLRIFAESCYIKEGVILSYLSWSGARMKILDEKKKDYEIRQKISRIKNPLLKERLKEYYRRYRYILKFEGIPETLAIDYRFIYEYHHNKGCWFRKIGGEWYINYLFVREREETLLTGVYRPLIVEYNEDNAPYVLLQQVSLKEEVIKPPYTIFQRPILDDLWVIGFEPTEEKSEWRVFPLFIPVKFEVGKSEGDNVLLKYLNKIDSIYAIKEKRRVGYYTLVGFQVSEWWVADRFCVHGWDRVKVGWFHFSPSVKEMEMKTIRVPWVEEPCIKEIKGIVFYVRPSGNKAYILWHIWIRFMKRTREGIINVLSNLYVFPFPVLGLLIFFQFYS